MGTEVNFFSGCGSISLIRSSPFSLAGEIRKLLQIVALTSSCFLPAERPLFFFAR